LLRCLTIVVVEQAAQPLPPLDRSSILQMAQFWKDQPVSQALVVTLGKIMRHEFMNRFS
jgi:hypothetical protein